MLQVGFAVNPIVSGALTFVSAISAILIRPILSYLLRKFGFDRILIWNALTGAALVAGFALIGPHTPSWLIVVYVSALASRARRSS